MIEKGKGRTTDCIKLSNDIKKMIMSIKFDYDELQKELEEVKIFFKNFFSNLINNSKIFKVKKKK